MAKRYDFGGWATKNNIKCADGRTIRKNAFKDNDGDIVPLVYMHSHDDPENIIGHALLENREDGVYCYCSLNDNPKGKAAKESVRHGDVRHMSIYANHLKQNGGDVIHGTIREVSLVLAGANPGAMIDSYDIMHGVDSDESGLIYTDEVIDNMPLWVETSVSHSDPEDKKKEEEEDKKIEEPAEEPKEEPKEAPKAEEPKEEPAEEPKEAPKAEEPAEESKEEDKLKHADSEGESETEDGVDAKKIYDNMSEDKKNAITILIALLSTDFENGENPEEIEVPVGKDGQSSGKTVKQIFDTMTDDERKVAGYVIVKATKEVKDKMKDAVQHSDEGGNTMHNNVFEQNVENEENVLTHDDMVAVLKDISTYGTLKNAALQHGITNLEVMFPDAQLDTKEPIMVERDQEWVSTVLSGVKKNPFARIKCIYADITGAQARAKGYLGADKFFDANGKPLRDAKGNLCDDQGNRVYKEEEVIPLLKREVLPTTVYKKQKMDRNDIIDITEFDVIVWLKAEMRTMLDEEVARAILVGDGRTVSDPDKIKETSIIPIWTDADFYTIKGTVNQIATDTDDTIASKLIDQAVRSKKKYKGSGATVMYANEDYLTDMLLLKDTMGHRLYKTEQELAAAMRVTKIISVPVMEGLQRTDSDDNTFKLAAIIVNLKDYSTGTDKKGAVTMFDDFDIDYNQEKYLIETRLSGMLTKPYSAIALEVKTAG